MYPTRQPGMPYDFDIENKRITFALLLRSKSNG